MTMVIMMKLMLINDDEKAKTVTDDDDGDAIDAMLSSSKSPYLRHPHRQHIIYIILSASSSSTN